MNKVFDKVKNTTTFIVNNRELKIPGVGNANQGRLTSKVTHDFPFSIELLAPMMIVGYPTYSEYKDGACDLFKPSTLLGGYKYQRSYRFSNGATFSSFHNINFDTEKNSLAGNFSTKNFPEDALKGDWSVCDFIETFIPHAPGIIKSIMAVQWKDGDKTLQAIIESEYYFNHNKELPCLHWRHVKFANEHDGKNYTQSEKLTVFNNLEFGEPTNQFK